MSNRQFPLSGSTIAYIPILLFAACTPALVQGQQSASPPPDAAPQQQSAPSPGGWHRFSDPRAGAPNPSQQMSNADQRSLPEHLTIKPGAFLTVRTDQVLSSDRNQPGDGFSATLQQPIVVDGIVIAQRGQTVGGRVVDAQKAGRVKGTSRLGLRLTNVTAVDGQSVPIQSEFMGVSGPKSLGRDASAVAGSTAVGAAIGAAADWGTGAAIGAGAGALTATVGVLLTRGRATVIYPESVLTFRLEAPVTISTQRAPQAFRYVERSDYGLTRAEEGARPRPPCLRYGCVAPPRPDAYYWPPYYYGPSFGFFYGPRFYYGRGFWFRR